MRSACAAAAAELQATLDKVPSWVTKAGDSGLRESDLQRGVCRGLQKLLGPVVAIEGPLPPGIKQHWCGRLGRADVLARLPSAGDLYIETKLCWEDKLHEAVWDVLKLAAITTMPDIATGYVVYAAPLRRWHPKTTRPVELFADGRFEIVELLGNHKTASGRCLKGTATTRPARLPAHVRTEEIGRAGIDGPGDAWELRCARVQGAPDGGWSEFGPDGWPCRFVETS
ncbi:MAG: hypothetical protein ACYCUM_14465 [Solirubrobacteraceae bacterium]